MMASASSIGLKAKLEPGTLIASFGLAFAMFLYDLKYMSSIVSVDDNGLGKLMGGAAYLAVALLVALACLARPAVRIHRRTPLCVGIAFLQFASILVALDAGIISCGEQAKVLFSLLSQCCNAFLLACWADMLLMVSARQVATVFALSSVIFGGLSAVASLLKDGGSGILIALMPFLSVTCQYWYKDRLMAQQDDALPGSRFDRSLVEGPAGARLATSVLSFLLPLLFFPVVYGYIHAAWLPYQDGGIASALIQLSAAVGAAVGGGVLWVLTGLFWGRRKLLLYVVFALLLASATLFLVELAPGGAPYPYVVLLNIAHKISFLFVWLAPFLVPTRFSPLVSWCAAMGLYQLGKIIFNLAAALLGGFADGVITFASLLALVVCLALGAVGDQKSPTETASSDCGTKAERPERPESDAGRDDYFGRPVSSDAASLLLACNGLATEYGLSNRERDVLVLLAQGCVAKDIAETLVVSNATAKTHIHNLYQKTGVHSQTELLLLLIRHYGRS